jgi:RNA-directed DNA polymerase
VLEQTIQPLVEQFMRERGLALSREKTVITHIEDGYDFLGQHIRKYDGKLLIKPSPKNVQTFLQEVRKVIKGNKQTPTGKLISLLNPLIRGWAEYHRHVVSKATFAKVDAAIFTALWRWAKRRHPTKGRGWIRDKYFPPCGGKHWLLQGERVETGKPPRDAPTLSRCVRTHPTARENTQRSQPLRPDLGIVF